MSSRWLSTIIVWVVWLSAPRAMAVEDELLVALVGAEARPEIVCVVTQEPERYVQPSTKDKKQWHPRSTKEVFGAETAKDSATWDFHGDVVPVDEKRAEDAPERARQLLLGRPNPTVVFSSQKECAPALQLQGTATYQVFCAWNQAAGTAGGGVAILELGYGTAPARSVNVVSVAGNLVTINFHPLRRDARGGPITGRVAGGHFGVTSHELLSGHVARLTLEPRCYSREIELPQVAGEHPVVFPTLQLSDGREWSSPTAPLRQRLSVALPRGAGGRPVLTVQVRTALSGAPRDALGITGKFSAEWTSEVPPLSPELRVRSLRFEWRKPCEYPYPGCPDVRLASTGAVAAGQLIDEDTCRYSVSDSGHSFTLPEEVTFHHEKLPEWRAQVSHAGQQLEAYSSAELRQLVVRMPWHGTTVPGDEIDSVEILGPSGIRHKLAPQWQAQISVPYASCGDQLGYVLHGARQFSPGEVDVVQGPIELPAPGATASVWEIGLAGGAGFMFAENRDDRPFLSAEVGVRVQPAGRLNEPQAWWHPSSADYELAFSYHYAYQPYQPLHSADFAEDDENDSVPYNRLLLSAYVTWALHDFHLGPGGGIGFGYPVFTDHQARAGAENMIATVAARVRYSINNVWEVVGTPRFLFGEEIYRYSANDGLASTPERTPQKVTSFMLDLALQGWL